MSLITRMAAVAAAATLTFTLAACGGSDDTSSRDRDRDRDRDRTSQDSDRDTEPDIDITPQQPEPEPEPEPDTDISAQHALLDEYIRIGSADLDSFREMYADVYSHIDIVADYPGTIHYQYTFVSPLDPAEVDAEMAGTSDTLRSTAENLILPEMEQWGIAEQRGVIWSYYNPDGSLLWSIEVYDD